MFIWKKLRSRIFARNDHWEYHIDDFLLDEQRERQYHYVHTEGSTMIIPLLPDNRVVLVQQYRYLNQKFGLEFPCGAVQKTLTPEENALKELREETGYTAAVLSPIGAFTPYTGAADETCHVYLAEGLSVNPLPPDETEELVTVVLSIQELQNKIQSNEIWDGLTLAAWSLAQPKLISRV